MKSTVFHIKLADPNIAESDERAVRSVLASGRLVKGPFCRELEEGLRQVTGRRFAVAVSSGSMALLAAMKGLGVGPGDTVVVPALTFPAPAFVASFLGATVRLADVDPRSFNLSCDTLCAALDDQVRLVVAIDQFGALARTADMDAVTRPRGIPVLVDAACSLGGSLSGAPAGSFGIAATLSFHPRKVITTGEGGAVLTDDEPLAREVARWADQGVENRAFVSIGLNLRLGEINCAIGVEQLNRLGGIVEKRQRLAARYHELPLRFQEIGDDATSNYQTLAAVLPSPATSADRDALIRHLAEQGIESTIASYCLGTSPGLREALGVDDRETPVAREVHERGIALPLHPGLSDRDVDEVVVAVYHWLRQRGWS